MIYKCNIIWILSILIEWRRIFVGFRAFIQCAVSCISTSHQPIQTSRVGVSSSIFHFRFGPTFCCYRSTTAPLIIMSMVQNMLFGFFPRQSKTVSLFNFILFRFFHFVLFVIKKKRKKLCSNYQTQQIQTNRMVKWNVLNPKRRRMKVEKRETSKESRRKKRHKWLAFV